VKKEENKIKVLIEFLQFYEKDCFLVKKLVTARACIISKEF